MGYLRDKLKVFISSTLDDLKSEREQIIITIKDLEFEAIAMEFFGSRPGKPLEECLKEVNDSDIYVLVVGERYGSIPEGEEKSYTELEYSEAKKDVNKMRFAYLKELSEPYEDERLSDFVGLLRNESIYYRFASPDDLAERVKKDIMREISRLVHTHMECRPDFYGDAPRIEQGLVAEGTGDVPVDRDVLLFQANIHFLGYRYTKALYLAKRGLQIYKGDEDFAILKNMLTIEMRNLGYNVEDKEVLESVDYFKGLAEKGKFDRGIALYNAGNGYAAINMDVDAIDVYEAALSAGLDSA